MIALKEKDPKQFNQNNIFKWKNFNLEKQSKFCNDLLNV